MRDEILKLRGRLAEAEHRKLELETMAAADIVSIRHLADPFEDNLSRIKSAEIVVESQSLNKTITEIKQVNEKISQYKQELGECAECAE